MNLLSSSLLMILLFSLAFLFAMVFRILVCCALYFDAKALGLKKYTAVIVLALFFPLIVAIVHLCTRKDAPKVVPRYCLTCNSTVPNETKVCPNCGGMAFVDYVMAGHDKNKKITKIMSIFSIICMALTIALSVGAVSTISDAVEYYSKDKNSFSDGFNGDFNENPFEDDDLEDFFGGINPFSNYGY